MPERPLNTDVPASGRVITVLGEVEPHELGLTLPHEHLFVDLQAKYEPPPPEVELELRGPLRMDMLGLLHQNYKWNSDNLLLENEETVEREVALFRHAGGGTICDVSSRGIRRDTSLPALMRIAATTGVHIVVATGSYTATFHDDLARNGSIADLTQVFCDEVRRGIGTSGVRAGIIGEIGLSARPTERELIVLRAAAEAHLRTGAPIAIHQRDPNHFDVPHFALDILEEHGVAPPRVVFAHGADCQARARLQELLDRGASISIDYFGIHGFGGRPGGELPRDVDYARLVADLCAAGYTDQVLVSHDVCNKMHLRTWGGHGYAYIPTWIRTVLETLGLSSSTIEALLVENPRRWLTLGF